MKVIYVSACVRECVCFHAVVHQNISPSSVAVLMCVYLCTGTYGSYML